MNIFGTEVECISWSLSVNGHKEVYQEPEIYFKNETNLDYNMDIYCLRYYPIAPVGFIEIFGNTLEDIIKEIKDDMWIK